MKKIEDKEFDRLVKYIQSNFGINLSRKRTLVEGRLGNVITEKGFNTYNDYFDMVFADKSGKEIDQLIIRLTTNHTYFMREPEHFEYMTSVVLPFLKKENAKTKMMRIWSAGCSSGAEAYTAVMNIKEFLGTEASAWDTRILCTDISHKVLAAAQKGIYDLGGIRDVPPAWQKKYFTVLPDDRCKISPSLRKEVIFKEFNLMDPIPFKKGPFDLIFCRNVMIYFDAETKNALVNRFYDVLRPGGYLFIGHAESIARDQSKYQYIKPAIYRKPL